MSRIDFTAFTATSSWRPFLALMWVSPHKGDFAADDMSVGLGPTCVRGLCHGIPSRFLPARADRSGGVVPDALWAVAIGACCSSPKDTQAAAAPRQALQKAQALSGSHPSTLLRCL